MRDNTLDKVIHSRFEWINSYNSNYLREVVFNYAASMGKSVCQITFNFKK